MRRTTNTTTPHILTAEAMLADLEARRAAGLARNPPIGSGTVEAFDLRIAAVRRLIARLAKT